MQGTVAGGEQTVGGGPGHAGVGERRGGPRLGPGPSREGSGSLAPALDEPGFPRVTGLAAGWAPW